MKKGYLLLFILLLFYEVSIAQKEANYWYFGENAGLDFSAGNPVAINDGALNTLEGCATISDTDGNLLFYTDGVQVWNRNHTTMPTGRGLLGDSSSSQSAIIVPKPNNRDVYYIFTVDWSGGRSGLNYYTVDMSLEDGLGDVLGTNGVPSPTRLIGSPLSEKITAVQNLNGDAFWVLSLKSGRFYVYKVDVNGVQETPVTGNDNFLPSIDPRGYMKVSPDGTKVACANMNSGAFLYDFDSATGKVTNERRLNFFGGFPYGIEFSPESKKLYISSGDFGNGLAEEKLFQYTVDMPNPTATNINASSVEIHSYTNSRAALQLASDGKIYRAIDGSSFLGVINDPDNDGINANYIHNAISLGERVSKQGLPPFIQSFFVAGIQVENSCQNNETSFSIVSNKPIISIEWNFGDGSPPVNSINPTHVYTVSGSYEVVATVTTDTEIKIIKKNVIINPLPSINPTVRLQQCDDNNDGISIFNLTESETLISDEPNVSFSYYLGENDAIRSTNKLEEIVEFVNNTTSIVYARAENEFGCFDIARVDLDVVPSNIPPNINFEFAQCDYDENEFDGVTTFDFSDLSRRILDLYPAEPNLSISYFESIDDAFSEINAIDASNFRNESSPFRQNIVVRIEDVKRNSCTAIASIVTLKVLGLPQFEIEKNAYICTNLLDASTILAINSADDNYNYEWRNSNDEILNSDSVTFLRVFEIGTYSVTASSSLGCETTKTIEVSNSELPIIDSVEVLDNSNNNSITIIVSGIGQYEFALDSFNGSFQESNSFSNVSSGMHTVFVKDKNGCGTVSKEVFVVGYPKFLTPNGDGFNDTWKIKGLDNKETARIYIYDRYGKLLIELDPQGEGWDGTFNGKPMPATDYWFKMKLRDGRLLRGNFSLIKK